MEDLEHPGFIDFGRANFDSYLELRRKNRSFEDFQPFIASENMPPKIASEFQYFLRLFFNKTKDEWEPGKCRDIPRLAETANQVAATNHIFNGKSFVPKRFSRGHYWLEINLDGIGKLIVDPAGVPKDPKNDDRRQILPYFGPVDDAPEYAKTIYAEAKDMDDWGTRDLPPGFHP